jgi:thiamine pyrophosphate-dependent acetolactate synthase large subunit-like protein
MPEAVANSAGRSARKVYDVLAEAFAAEGVSVMFNIMGYGNRHFMVRAAQSGIRLVTARHEGAALAMADGYARAGGDVGVISVHYGPGVTQLATSIMVANKAGTPLVIFAAGISRDIRHRGGPLDLDERSLLQASGAIVIELQQAEKAAETVHFAFHQARRHGKPVALLAPIDLQEQTVEIDQPDPGPVPDLGRPVAVPPQDAVAEAVSLLRQAKRPLVLAGRGALSPRAKDVALQIADHLGALVATTFGAKGLFDGHPRSLAAAGGFALHADRELLEQADCVLAIGASLNARTTDRGTLFAGARILQIDDHASAFEDAESTGQVRLLGDAAATLEQLAAALLTGEQRSTWSPDVLARLAGSDSRQSELAEYPKVPEPGTVDPRQFMLDMDAVLPDDAVIVVGGGHCMTFAVQYLRNPSGRSFELVFDFMTTGQALGSAIGAALACPGRPVVAVEGDASILMHIQELETAARHGIPLLILVLNDGALGAEYHGLVADGMDASPALASTPALARVAEAFGGAGMDVAGPGSAEKIMRWYDPARGPHLVDVRIPLSIVAL